MDYNKIFTENILRIQAERGLSKQELAEIAGVSGAFITDLVRGTANPTIKSLQSFSEGLGVPLPLLLKSVASEEWQTILSTAKAMRTIPKENDVPEGFGVIKAVLPLHKIYVVEQWIKEAKKKMRKIKTQ